MSGRMIKARLTKICNATQRKIGCRPCGVRKKIELVSICSWSAVTALALSCVTEFFGSNGKCVYVALRCLTYCWKSGLTLLYTLYSAITHVKL